MLYNVWVLVWLCETKKWTNRKGKLYYKDTNIYSLHTKKEHIYSDNAKDIETRVDTSEYKLERPLFKWKSKNIIGFEK